MNAQFLASKPRNLKNEFLKGNLNLQHEENKVLAARKKSLKLECHIRCMLYFLPVF
jgi:hypothetical protein